MSESAERLTGISLATVFGTALEDQLDRSAVPEWAAAVGDSFRTGAATSIERLPLRRTRTDGTADSAPLSCIA